MNASLVAGALASALTLAAAPAAAGTIDFSGTRSNVSLGASPGGRCAPALTVQFSPGGPGEISQASGTSTLGGFSYVASHCIVPPLPAAYFDGVFEWDFGHRGTLFGTYAGELTPGGAPGQFGVAEDIVFTGGTGRFAGAGGTASAFGTLVFGAIDGVAVSFGETSFAGHLSAPAIPEPGTWALMAAGLGLVAGCSRRRRRAETRQRLQSSAGATTSSLIRSGSSQNVA
jgi:hypothetical protein